MTRAIESLTDEEREHLATLAEESHVHQYAAEREAIRDRAVTYLTGVGFTPLQARGVWQDAIMDAKKVRKARKARP